MKHTLISTAMVIGMLALSPAFAAAETTDLHVPPQTKTDVREWVAKNKPRGYRFPQAVIVGATIPNDVETSAVPEAWGHDLLAYHYAYGRNRVYVVEPTSRRLFTSLTFSESHYVCAAGATNIRCLTWGGIPFIARCHSG